MRTDYDYGIICEIGDEEKIVKNINTFLEKIYHYRKMTKRNKESDLESRLPFIYKHFYCQFLLKIPYGEEIGRWYFDLIPNSDLNGKMKFPNRKDVGWILWISKKDVPKNTQAQNEYLNKFFSELLDAVGYDVVLIHEYEDGEDRL